MSNSAHSLLELLVVIALIAILASVGVAGYSHYTEQARIAVDEDYVMQVFRLLQIENAGNVGEIWITIPDGTFVYATARAGLDPVPILAPPGETMDPHPLQSNTYAQSGAQYLVYDGEAFRTAYGDIEDLLILRAIYLALGGYGTVRVVTDGGRIAAVYHSDTADDDRDLPDHLRSAVLKSPAYQTTTLTSADGFTWQIPT